MNEIREILENLARVSHQSRGTDSYYTIVEKTLSEIKKKIEGMKQEFTEELVDNMIRQAEQIGYKEVFKKLRNYTIDNIASMFGDKS